MLQNVFDQGGVVTPHEHDVRVTILQGVRQLRHAGARIERDRNKTAIHRAQEQLRREQPVIHQEGDLIPVRQAHALKPPAQMTELLLQRLEGQLMPGLGAHQEDAIRLRLSAAINQITNRLKIFVQPHWRSSSLACMGKAASVSAVGRLIPAMKRETLSLVYKLLSSRNINMVMDKLLFHCYSCRNIRYN